MFFPLDVLKRDVGNIFLSTTIFADYNDDSYRNLVFFNVLAVEISAFSNSID